MLEPQTQLFVLFGVLLVLLIWGRWRYDIVAFAALIVALLLGLVPAEKAFTGFGHPATIIIALVLIVSRGLTNSGVIDQLGRRLNTGNHSVPVHIGMMSAIAAAMSSIMNNVAALALLMPLDLRAAAKAKRPPGQTLMALSFATLLGGLVTLIGTPSNIVVSAIRETALGQPYGMFDFAPVGGLVALAGLVFVAIIGWRLVPTTPAQGSDKVAFELDDYVVEAVVEKATPAIGKSARELAEELTQAGAELVAISRDGIRLPAWIRGLLIAEGDILVIEAAAEVVDGLLSEHGFAYLVSKQQAEAALGDLALIEVVVPPGAILDGRTVEESGLLARFTMSLVGVSRQGQRFHERIRRLRIEAGDVLLLMIPEERRSEILASTGCLPLARRGLTVAKRTLPVAAAAVFATAIAFVVLGFMGLPVALAICVVVYIAMGLVGTDEVYTTVEWPVIVLLGSLIPLGEALEASNGANSIANGLLALTQGFPHWVALTWLMVVTLALANVLSNVATAVIAAPIAIAMAKSLQVRPDAFLMAVAIAAASAFLTPLGHKNNILVLGPGGYKFSDFWRMGLPLEVVIVVVSVPLLLVFWPL